MVPGDAKYFIFVIFIPAVFPDSYTILLENDTACRRNDYHPTLLKVGVDDIVLHEQLVMMWPGNVVEPLNNNYSLPTRSLFGACSGILIRPSGRFVQRTLTEGMVSFWLLRAEATLTCSRNIRVLNNYFIKIDQWMEPHPWTGGPWISGGTTSHDQESTHPIIYNAVPDKSLQLNCSDGKQVVAAHISGYVRRVKVTWNLRGALAASQSPSASLENSSTAENLQGPQQPPELLSPELSVRIRITSRMLFHGNFSSERQRVLCEFFSGFWCDSLIPSGTSPSTMRQAARSDKSELDQDACVPATMRCDNLPDCNPHQTSLSADEINCEVFTGNYSFNRSDRLGNSTVLERWTSRLPWLVLAPVPLVLICALVRICSQKRQLDLTEVGDFSRFQPNGTGDHQERSQSLPVNRPIRGKFADGQRLLRRKRRGLQLDAFESGNTLASVAEVDELDVDSRSRTSSILLKEKGEESFNSMLSNGSPRSNGALGAVDYQMEVTVPSSEIKSTLPFLHHSIQSLPIDRNRPNRRTNKYADKTRRYLCWSAILDPVSSSSSSQSACEGSSGSVCSHCGSVSGQPLGRSRSCDDILMEDKQTYVEDGGGMELQPLVSLVGEKSGDEGRRRQDANVLETTNFDNTGCAALKDHENCGEFGDLEYCFHHERHRNSLHDPLHDFTETSNSGGTVLSNLPCARMVTVVATVSGPMEPANYPSPTTGGNASSNKTREIRSLTHDQPNSSPVGTSKSILRQTKSD
ncbi:hypothetical protein CRM22_008988 [Opisthorchis felineus]|uniref:Uncharacterized protein n=2 Tax=Opisthorchis felineus TaxID=147828 RepID=A0A4V3SD70_OPIFE|nr:hypothetical protein CRM22_008988 [Opisthorchis felineus]